MGTSTSAAQMVKKINTAKKNVEARQTKAVGAAALAAKDIIEQEASRSGLKPRSSKLVGRRWRGVRYDIKGTRNPTALVRATGPAWLHDQPTKAHRIAAKRSPSRRRKRRRGAKALSFGRNHPVAAVNHPGTRGKGWWRRGVNRAEKKAPDAYARNLRDTLTEVFG